MSFAQEQGAFLQKSTSMSKTRRARHVLMSLAQVSRSHQTQLELIASALKSKAVDFSKITGMIDGMVDVLSKEQEDDDSQKKFCEDEFSKSAAEKKETEETLASLAASLDKAVAEATETRKSEHEAFLTTQAESQACMQ